jgi:hypothetical protein
MTREALAEELSDLVERYRHSTAALEVFVGNSLKSIDQNRATMLEALKKIRGALRGEEPVTEPGVETVSVAMSTDEWEALANVVTKHSRYFELHPQMLLEMSLAYAGALFEAFISDVLITILRNIPERLRSGRTLTVEEVLRFRDRDELIEDLVHREVLDLMYKSAEKQFDYFRTSFGVDVFEDKSLMVSIAGLAAVRERRNLVAHNNGLASAEYIAKFDTNAAVGDRVVSDAESAGSDRKVLSKVAIALASRLRDELTPAD